MEHWAWARGINPPKGQNESNKQKLMDFGPIAFKLILKRFEFLTSIRKKTLSHLRQMKLIVKKNRSSDFWMIQVKNFGGKEMPT
jgi:hypothetical protein